MILCLPDFESYCKKKHSLPSGIPRTVKELKHIVQETFAIEQDFSMQFHNQPKKPILTALPMETNEQNAYPMKL